jgi:hypothetical protein
VRVGQDAPSPELGGWYGTYGFAPGSQFGQWMSALSRLYAIIGDGTTRAKVRRMVRGYAATIDAKGGFYHRNRLLPTFRLTSAPPTAIRPTAATTPISRPGSRCKKAGYAMVVMDFWAPRLSFARCSTIKIIYLHRSGQSGGAGKLSG